jgi:hypothetical protein
MLKSIDIFVRVVHGRNCTKETMTPYFIGGEGNIDKHINPF